MGKRVVNEVKFLMKKCIYYFCICFIFMVMSIEISGEEIRNIESISENTVEIDIASEMISAETESNSTDGQEEINTLGIFYLVPGVAESEIKNTVFYIDGIPYEVTGNEIVIRVNSADTSIHTVYAVADGYAQSGTKTFSFIGMQSSVMALFAYSEDGANISYVTGVLKVIDFLFFGKIHMEDGTSYDFDHDLIEDDRGLKGKTIICTLKDGIVIDFKEYTATNSETTEIEANDYSKVYGKEKKPLTNQEKVLKAANEYNSAMINYYGSLGQTAQKKLKQTNSTSQDKGKQLRAIDEAKGADRMLTIDANMPDKAIDSAYAALSDFLDEYKATGVELGKINLSEEKVEIEARIVNQIINNIGCNGLPRRKYGNYYVEISALSIWGNYTGTVIVQGKGKTYYSVINSSTKEVAQTMEDYLNELADMTKDLDKQALQSIVNEFIDTTYIGSITKDQIKKLFKDQASHISKYGFGKEIIDISNNLLEDYKQAKSILELRNIDGFDDAMVNARTIHKNLKMQDYTFEMGSGDDCPIVRDAVSRVDKARNNFISALSDYLYSTDSYTEQDNSSTWDNCFKIFINCPVDFSIYDKSGNRIAYYEDDKVSADTSSVRIELIGDRKIIYVNSGMSYIGNIKLTATDDGAMDYIVERYVDGVSVERANYYDIPLEEGNTFTQNANWDDLSTFTTQNPLIANSGAEITADEYLAVTDDAVINVVSSISAGGKVIGDGAYVKGDTVSLSAIPEEGYRFDGWYVDGELQDGNTTYHFTAEKNVTVKAEFVATDIVHPDYKAVVAREYRDFAGTFVYKNKSVSGNVDILLRLEGEAYSSAYDSFKVKGYLDDNLVVEKTFTVDAKSQSSVRLENIDLKGSEHVEIYDGNDVPIAYVVYVPDYRNLDDLVINADTVLEEDTYCNDLTVNSDLNLNGHDLIVVGEVSGHHIWEGEGKIANLTTVSVTDGTLKVLGDINALIDIELNHGEFFEYGNINMNRGGLSLSYDDDKVIAYGDVVYDNSDGQIVSGIMEFFGDVYLYSDINVTGTNKAIFKGSGQQVIRAEFNQVEFANMDIVSRWFGAEKLLSDLKIKGERTPEGDVKLTQLKITDSNGYKIEVESDVEISSIMSINGGTVNVKGDVTVSEGGKVNVNNALLKIDGNFIGGEEYYDKSGYYSQGILALNKGQCYITGDFLAGYVIMKQKQDLLDVDGNLRIESDNLSDWPTCSDLSGGTIKLAGDLLSTGYGYTMWATGTHTFIFDGDKTQKVYNCTFFNNLIFENENGISVESDSFGFKSLLSDGKIMTSDDLGTQYFVSHYEYYDEEINEYSVVNTTTLNGHSLTIEGNVDIDGHYDLAMGSLNITGNVDEFTGFIDINKGKLIAEGDFCLDQNNYEDPKLSMIIMDDEEDLFEVHGRFYVRTGYNASFLSNNRQYSSSPKTKEENPAISAGTIKFYGDVDLYSYEDEDIIDFVGTNKVILCGSGIQHIEMGMNTFNQTECRNDNIISEDSVGLGKLLTDIKLSGGGLLRNIIFNGHKLEMNGRTYIDDLDINNGILQINGNLFHCSGEIRISNGGELHVLGDYSNSGDDTVGTIILESAEEIFDVDGNLSYDYSGGLNNGTVKLAGDIYFYSLLEEYVIDANIVLDGTGNQRVVFEDKIGKFNKLTITQPINNYHFYPDPCWNTLLNADGNVISGQQNNGSDSNQSTNSGNNNQSTAKPDDSKKPESSSKMEVGTKVSVGKVQYKVIQSSEYELSVAFEKCEDKKAVSVSIPNTVVINGVPYKVTSIEKNAFKNNKNLKKVIVGKNIEIIKEGAFYGCTKLSKISMGSNVLAIDNKAFYKCSSLTKITIPAKVGKIGKQAFYGCKNLKSITVKTTKLTNKNVGSKAFQGIHKKANIKVPKKKLSAYKKLFKGKGLSGSAKIAA